MLFLLAIADLIHPLSNNQSSIGIIGCFMQVVKEEIGIKGKRKGFYAFEKGRSRRPGIYLQRNTEKTKYRYSPESRVDDAMEGRIKK